MKLPHRLLIVLLLLAIAAKTGASATKHEYQIPGLVGVHTHIDKTFTAPFDLKTTFAEIGNVELYLEGNAAHGSAVATEGGQEAFELPVNLDIAIDEHFIPQMGSLKTPIATFTSLSGNFETQKIFKPRPRAYKADWSFLKNGKGELRLSWGMECPGACRYLNHSTVIITKAVLIVDEALQSDEKATIKQITMVPVDAGRESSPYSITRPDSSGKTTGTIKPGQPEKSGEIMKIAKADNFPTVTTEASDNSRTMTGDTKPKETKDDLHDSEPQPQDPDQIFICDNNAVDSSDGPVCGHEHYQVHCVREPCPRQSRWHSYPNVETACSYKGIQVYVREFARGECIVNKIDRHYPQ